MTPTFIVNWFKVTILLKPARCFILPGKKCQLEWDKLQCDICLNSFIGHIPEFFSPWHGYSIHFFLGRFMFLTQKSKKHEHDVEILVESSQSNFQWDCKFD